MTQTEQMVQDEARITSGRSIIGSIFARLTHSFSRNMRHVSLELISFPGSSLTELIRSSLPAALPAAASARPPLMHVRMGSVRWSCARPSATDPLPRTCRACSTSTPSMPMSYISEMDLDIFKVLALVRRRDVEEIP
jgi:hypothetical protein